MVYLCKTVSYMEVSPGSPAREVRIISMQDSKLMFERRVVVW